MPNSAMTIKPSRPHSRSRLSVALAIVCVGAFLSWSAPIVISLYDRWLRAGFEHGYPIAILSIFLVVSSVRRRGFSVTAPSGVGLAFLTLFVFLTTIAYAATVTIIPELLLPVMILAFVWAMFGWKATAVLLAPLLFLYFSIPFWQLFEILSIAAPSLNEELRLLTTFVASVLVRATGIPAYIDGDLIHISAGTFKIAQGCSGRAYFIVALELSLFFGIAYLHTWKRRLTLVGVAAVLSLIGNWVRVFALIVIGNVTNMESSLIDDHESFGWVIFALILVPVFLIGRHLEEKDEEQIRGISSDAPAPYRVGVAVPVLMAIVLATGIFTSYKIHETYAQPAESGSIHFPNVREWVKGESWLGDSRPDFRAPAADSAMWYRNSRASVGVYLANYPAQRQGSEAIFFANRPTGNIGEIVRQGRVELESASTTKYSFRQYWVADGSTNRLVWHGVVAAGKSTHGALHAKVVQTMGAIGGRVDAQVVVLTTSCELPTCEDAASILSDFARVAIDDLYAAAERSTSTQLQR